MGTDVKPALSRCFKQYQSTGEWGIKVKYNAPTEAGPKPRLGYLPYLGSLSGGAGPMVSEVSSLLDHFGLTKIAVLIILPTVDRIWKRFPSGGTIAVAVQVCHWIKILRVSSISLSYHRVP
jgi:hypothetical protein